jgi:hypothetical protein
MPQVSRSTSHDDEYRWGNTRVVSRELPDHEGKIDEVQVQWENGYASSLERGASHYLQMPLEVILVYVMLQYDKCT